LGRSPSCPWIAHRLGKQHLLRPEHSSKAASRRRRASGPIPGVVWARDESIRSLLRQGIISMVDQIWRENGADSAKATPFVGSTQAQSLYDEILKLSLRDKAQRSLQTRAIDAPFDLAKARLLLFACGTWHFCIIRVRCSIPPGHVEHTQGSSTILGCWSASDATPASEPVYRLARLAVKYGSE
jgi:hypothetical protein